MRLATDVALGLYQIVRESLPSTSEDAVAFLSAAVWGFLAAWTMLVLLTYWYLVGRAHP